MITVTLWHYNDWCCPLLLKHWMLSFPGPLGLSTEKLKSTSTIQCLPK